MVCLDKQDRLVLLVPKVPMARAEPVDLQVSLALEENQDNQVSLDLKVARVSEVCAESLESAVLLARQVKMAAPVTVDYRALLDKLDLQDLEVFKALLVALDCQVPAALVDRRETLSRVIKAFQVLLAAQASPGLKVNLALAVALVLWVNLACLESVVRQAPPDLKVIAETLVSREQRERLVCPEQRAPADPEVKLVCPVNEENKDSPANLAQPALLVFLDLQDQRETQAPEDLKALLVNLVHPVALVLLVHLDLVVQLAWVFLVPLVVLVTTVLLAVTGNLVLVVMQDLLDHLDQSVPLASLAYLDAVDLKEQLVAPDLLDLLVLLAPEDPRACLALAVNLVEMAGLVNQEALALLDLRATVVSTVNLVSLAALVSADPAAPKVHLVLAFLVLVVRRVNLALAVFAVPLVLLAHLELSTSRTSFQDLEAHLVNEDLPANQAFLVHLECEVKRVIVVPWVLLVVKVPLAFPAYPDPRAIVVIVERKVKLARWLLESRVSPDLEANLVLLARMVALVLKASLALQVLRAHPVCLDLVEAAVFEVPPVKLALRETPDPLDPVARVVLLVAPEPTALPEREEKRVTLVPSVARVDLVLPVLLALQDLLALAEMALLTRAAS